MTDTGSWQQLFDKIVGSWISRAIYVAAKLRIADRLANGPRTAAELAADVGVAPGPLYRTLRALTAVGVFDRQPHGRFGLNPLGEHLREHAAESLWAPAIMIGEEQDRCWGDLLETVRTGETAFDRLYGRPVFDYLGEHPEPARLFDTAMVSFSRRRTQAMLDAFDFSGISMLADVGGGTGSNLAAILGRYPAMRGLLFDVPRAVEKAGPLLRSAGLADRCRLWAGDFFKEIPASADAYLLSHILHDWDDEKAGLILDNLRRAISPLARLLVLEDVVPEGEGAWFTKFIDLHMMLVPGGLERTEDEYRRLFARHGFRLSRIVPTAAETSVIEAVPS